MEFTMILVGFAVMAAYIAITYNQLVSKRNLAEEGFSGMDVQLKRRHDLIPNLLETVKGYMQHEQSTLEKVTQMRAQAGQAKTVEDRAKAEAGLSAALGGIFAVAEQYPELKASQNFIGLQQELSGIEEQIQLARRYYNGSVRDLNTLAEQFPSNIVANMFHFEKKAYFEMESAAERAVPKVSFG